MAQSNMSGPFVITNGLQVGGTAHVVGALTADAGLSMATATWATSGATGGSAYANVLTQAGTIQATTAVKWAYSGATGGTAQANVLTQSGTVSADTLKWATTTATGGTATSTGLVIKNTINSTALAWGTTTATGGSITTDVGMVMNETVNAADLVWGTSAATGGTAAAGALDVGGSITASGHVKTTAGTLFFASRHMEFASASAGWDNATVYAVGDIVWNGTPASGSAVGWVCSGTGTGTAATFVGFGSIW